MRIRTRSVFSLALVASLAGCGKDDEGTGHGNDVGDANFDAADAADSGADAIGETSDDTDTGTDGTGSGDAAADSAEDTVSPPTGDFVEVKLTDISEEFDLDGLRYPVHISIDSLGIPHILAESAEDAMFAQGFMQARDRFSQMEFIRRFTGGTLGRLAGALDPDVIEDDIEQRMYGFRWVAQQMWDAMPEDSLSRRALVAHTAGINAWIHLLRSGYGQIPASVALFINRPELQDWSPIDSLAIVRYQQYSLCFDAPGEVRLSETRMEAERVFAPDSADPALAARAGILSDLLRWAPADPAWQFPGFEGGDDFGSPFDPGLRRPPESPVRWQAPSLPALHAALELGEDYRSDMYRRIATPHGMSNSWVVSGARTESGHAILANDPHLSLDSPALFHQAHLVVEPRTEDDGPALRVFGANFPGLPGALIGHNANLAWGLTTASYDYTDAYVEHLVWHDGEQFPRVLHNGVEVELEIHEEIIEIGARGVVSETITVEIPWVPHRGPLALPIDGRGLVWPEGDEAISYQWRGFRPSNEVAALIGFMTAENVDDVREALADWVIGTQNLVFADSEGNIYSTGHSYIPLREAAAMTWDPDTNPEGAAPWWTLDGDGSMDWIEPLDLSLVPHALNPDAGYIVTANNDQTGTTADNNPLNDYAYTGYDYDIGFRAGRIERLLTNETGEWEEGHLLTVEDIGRIQVDSHSNTGERLAPLFVEFLDTLIDEYQNPGLHPDLSTIVAANSGLGERLGVLRGLLAAWDFEAENGLWGSPTGEQVAQAGATSLFNFWTVALLRHAFGDERAAAPRMGLGEQLLLKGLLRIMEHGTESATYDEATGESALWDDLTTVDVIESRDLILAMALLDAEAELLATFGSDDPADWLWGRTHRRIFESLIPDLVNDVSPMQWPQPDETWANGFPRSGDNYNVDACNGGLGDYNFECGGGAILRLIVELDPDGVRTWNAIPGGQVWDPTSPHFRDSLQYWLDNERYEIPFRPSQVLAAQESHLLVLP